MSLVAGGEAIGQGVRVRVAADGADLFATILGAPGLPWLVACHGAGLDHQGFTSLAVAVSDRFRVLLWDLPGHGRSGAPTRPFTAELCARALEAVLDAAGASDAVILGFSFGGVVGQIFAKARPARVSGFIFYGCFSPHLLRPFVPAGLAPSAAKAAFALLDWARVRRRFAKLCCEEERARAEVEAAMAPLSKSFFLRVVAANLAAADYDPAMRIRGPVLLIRGARDSNGALMRATFRAYAAAYPAATQVVVKGAGHCVHLDQPELFVAHLRAFLAAAFPAPPPD